MTDEPPSSVPADPLPAVQDPGRLDALRETGLLDSPPEEAFDRLTRLATTILHVPISLVSLVDRERQFFKSCGGTIGSARQTPLRYSFCQHVVASRRPLVVTDARKHPVLKDNPALQELNVVAYAGFPLITPGGHVLGSFCAIDTAPRAWSADNLQILHTLAESTVTEIVLKLALRQLRAHGLALPGGAAGPA